MPKKILNKSLTYFILLFFLSSCSSIPKYPQNACKIFGENYLWYKSVKKSSELHGAPVHIILAFVKKESGFNRWAKPKRTKLFKIVPYKRPSSSFGYSQAVKKTNKINKIPLNDPYRQYLNYYLGLGSYAKKIYKTDKNAIMYAKSVEKQSKVYRNQLRECQKSLDRKKYIIF